MKTRLLTDLPLKLTEFQSIRSRVIQVLRQSHARHSFWYTGSHTRISAFLTSYTATHIRSNHRNSPPFDLHSSAHHFNRQEGGDYILPCNLRSGLQTATTWECEVEARRTNELCVHSIKLLQVWKYPVQVRATARV